MGNLLGILIGKNNSFPSRSPSKLLFAKSVLRKHVRFQMRYLESVLNNSRKRALQTEIESDIREITIHAAENKSHIRNSGELYFRRRYEQLARYESIIYL